MIVWTVTYDDRTASIAAPTYAEARAIARRRACRGRPAYRDRAAALAAGSGPALPCEDHWHASPEQENTT